MKTLPYTFSSLDSNNKTDEENDPLHLEEWTEEEEIPDYEEMDDPYEDGV